MQVKEIMTENPVCAEPSTTLQQVAQMMIDCDCGGIPVCSNDKLVGFVTDRDIVCRIVAKGQNPVNMTAQDAMSTDLHTVYPDTSVDECIRLMEKFQVRRVPVIDQQNRVVGIVAQADLVRRAVQKQPEILEDIEEALTEISEPKAAI